MSLPECTVNTNNIQNLPDSPTISAQELKQEFDKSGKDIKNYINETLIPAIENLVREESKNATDKINKVETSIAEKIIEDNKRRYPVGRLYISDVEVDPASILGFGVWEKIEDRFLLASGKTYKAKDVGGEATHKLTIDEMPKHNHDPRISLNVSQQGWKVGDAGVYQVSLQDKNRNTTDTGGDKPHNNMPPYYVVHVYRRTA